MANREQQRSDKFGDPIGWLLGHYTGNRGLIDRHDVSHMIIWENMDVYLEARGASYRNDGQESSGRCATVLAVLTAG